MYTNKEQDVKRVIKFLNETNMLDEKLNGDVMECFMESTWVKDKDLRNLAEYLNDNQVDGKNLDTGSVFFILESFDGNILFLANSIEIGDIAFYDSKWDLLEWMADVTGGQDFIENYVYNDTELMNHIVNNYLADVTHYISNSGRIGIWSDC